VSNVLITSRTYRLHRWTLGVKTYMGRGFVYRALEGLPRGDPPIGNSGVKVEGVQASPGVEMSPSSSSGSD